MLHHFQSPPVSVLQVDTDYFPTPPITIVLPLYTKNKNGVLYVSRCSRIDTREYIVVEEGLFIVGARYMTKEQIKKEYNINLPEHFEY